MTSSNSLAQSRVWSLYTCGSMPRSRCKCSIYISLPLSLLIMIFFTACLFILFTFSAHAVRPPRQGTTYDIEASYRVNFGTDVDGGCKTYETKIRTAYGELLDLMQGASDSLDDLKSPLPPDKGSAASNEWLRKSDAFFALFGARIPAAGWQTGDVQQESEKLTTRVWCMYDLCLGDVALIGLQ